jgi:hypothetical protein
MAFDLFLKFLFSCIFLSSKKEETIKRREIAQNFLKTKNLRKYCDGPNVTNEGLTLRITSLDAKSVDLNNE